MTVGGLIKCLERFNPKTPVTFAGYLPDFSYKTMLKEFRLYKDELQIVTQLAES